MLELAHGNGHKQDTRAGEEILQVKSLPDGIMSTNFISIHSELKTVRSPIVILNSCIEAHLCIEPKLLWELKEDLGVRSLLI